MNKMAWRMLLMMLAVMLVLAACSKNDDPDLTEGEPNAEEPSGPNLDALMSEPIDLVVYYTYAVAEGQWEQNQGGLIKERYPNINFEVIVSGPGLTPNEMAASRTPFDIFMTGSTLFNLTDVDLAEDLEPIARKYNYDLDRFYPEALQVARNMAEGRLVALPQRMNTMFLIYNKDLFDQFGVPYLRDDMTWDELYETARSLTRVHEGKNYYGFGSDQVNYIWMLNQYGHEMVDPQTKKVTLGDPFWQGYFSNFIRFGQLGQSLGENHYATLFGGTPWNQRFLQEQSLAIIYGQNGKVPRGNDVWPMNWDVARAPSFPDRMGVGPNILPAFMGVSTTSSKQEQAFAAIAAFMTDEAQKVWASRANPSPLRNPEVMSAFATDFAAVPQLQGKNVQAYIPSNMAPALTLDGTAFQVQGAFNGVLQRVSTGQMDLNTALREMEESANRSLEQYLNR